MTLEDASVLGQEISKASSLAQAFDAYYTRRFPRANAIQSFSSEVIRNELAGDPKQAEIINKSNSIAISW